MCPALEEMQNAIGDEAAAHCENMAVAMPMLMAAEQAHRLDQMQMVPGARHRHVEETALFLDLFTVANRHVRRDAAIDDVQHEDGIHSWPLAEWIVERTT